MDGNMVEVDSEIAFVASGLCRRRVHFEQTE